MKEDEYVSGMFKRRHVVMSVISEENLFRFDFPEQLLLKQMI